MSVPIHSNERPTLAGQVAGWWRNWWSARDGVAELQRCGPAETVHIARGVVTSNELCIMAGKWPGSADLLDRRLNQLKLDAAGIMRAEPQVMCDLQRVCTLCASQRRCKREFDKHSVDDWKSYCPNATTLSAMLAERGARAKFS